MIIIGGLILFLNESLIESFFIENGHRVWNGRFYAKMSDSLLSWKLPLHWRDKEIINFLISSDLEISVPEKYS